MAAKEKILGRIYVDDLKKVLEGIPYEETDGYIKLVPDSNIYKNSIYFCKDYGDTGEIEEIDVNSLNNRVELMEEASLTWQNLALAIAIVYTDEERGRDSIIQRLFRNYPYSYEVRQIKMNQ